MEVGPIPVFDLVQHILVIEFDRGLEFVLIEVPEISQRVLVGVLGLHVARAGDPEIARIGDGGIRQEVEVLGRSVVGSFDRAGFIHGNLHGDPGFDAGIGGHVRPGRILGHAVDVTILIVRVGVPRAEQPKCRHPQAIVQRDTGEDLGLV